MRGCGRIVSETTTMLTENSCALLSEYTATLAACGGKEKLDNMNRTRG